MRYNSAKSPRMTLMIYALVLAAAAVAVLYCVFFETVLRFVIAALCLVVVALVLWVHNSTWYELRERSLVLHSGPFNDAIAYKDIKTVDKTRGVNFVMALAFDRLQINANLNPEKGKIVLSPENEDEFLEELSARCDGLEIRG